MKIVFLCGCLEPGHDGVGDYVRRMASELIRQGHKAGAIALNDRNIEHEVAGLQEADGNEVPVLRLPFSWSSSARFTMAREWIELFNPQIVSLQYVPFSFNDKGLHFRLSHQLSTLAKKRVWHIMFHELWVVIDATTPKKNILWGNIQKRLIRGLISNLKPAVIHTQTKLYRAQLCKLGFDALHLPLFSNIPVKEKLAFEQGCINNDNPKKISFVSFGSIYPNALIEQFSKDAALYSKENEIEISLTFIGRSGAEQQRWTKGWQSEGLVAYFLGEQPPDRISHVLQNASFGLSSTPYPMTEKSGSVAAMREHGLPVICIASCWKPAGFDVERVPGVINYDEVTFEDTIRHRPSSPSKNTVLKVVERFLSDL